MVFSSLVFLLFFLPLTVGIYYLLPARWRGARNFWLLLMSLVFYGWGGIRYLGLLMGMIAIDYICGLLAASEHRAVKRLGVLAAVAASIGLIGYYKYAGFVTENLNAIGIPVEVLSVILPIGISFFTFQGLSYVIDVYRGEPVQRNFLNVVLYVAFFPQLVAGPIVRYTTVAEEIGHRRETVEEFADGLTRFCFGLGKKMLLANTMGQIADAVFGLKITAMPASLAWVGAVAYGLQIYFDFSAYSDMAIGLGWMFGFHFLENFDYPYISRSVTEFWRRWHISLSTWFRDYVYIPLGGNRCSKARHIFNLFVVWLLTGLWHGAAWNYVLWGLLFFVFLVGEKYLWGGLLKRLPAPVAWLGTMVVVLVGWVLFRSPDLGSAVSYLKAMLGMASGIQENAWQYYLLEFWPEWLLAIPACMPLRDWAKAKAGDGLRNWGPKVLAVILLILSYCRLVTGSFNPFIYFQF